MDFSEILLLSGADEFFVVVCWLILFVEVRLIYVSSAMVSNAISYFIFNFSDCWGDCIILCCDAVPTKVTTLSEEWICK